MADILGWSDDEPVFALALPRGAVSARDDLARYQKCQDRYFWPRIPMTWDDIFPVRRHDSSP